jgi:4-amino-4-deoxy-L-arabinose transferase-like glycosyltransferase
VSAQLPAHRYPQTPTGWLPFFFTRLLFTGAADPRTAVRFRSLLLVLFLPATLVYPTLNYRLLEPDEGRYAQIPREMLAAGDWLVPRLQGMAYLDKPPLFYWLVAWSYQIFGISEAAARLVPAIAVHLTILAVYLLGRRSLGERAALWAALLLTVSPGYLGIARLLLLDGLLTLWVTLSMVCAFEAVRTGRLLWGWWWAAAVASGLGFLTKGPISEVLLFPPLLAFAWLSRGSTARIGMRAAVGFAGVVLLVNAPWYLGILLKQPEFFSYFFWQHNVLRFLQPFDHLQPVWYYFPILLGGCFPFLVIVVSYFRQHLQSPGTEPSRASLAGGFWLLAGCWCVLFFSCSGSKLPTYILPAYPPLCLALGDYIARSRWDSRWSTRLFVTSGVVFLGVAIHLFLPWYAYWRSPMVEAAVVERLAGDRTVAVLTYPRNVDSVAFALGRSDLQRVRSTELNQALVDSHFRPRTVFLLTHQHSFAVFQQALPSSLRVVEHVSLRRHTGWGCWADRLVGETPWGLCDIAVIEPVALPAR